MRRQRQRPGAIEFSLETLYARHAESVLVFLARRTADPEIALDLCAETFAQALSGQAGYAGTTEAEAAGWLFGIARRQLAQYYRRGEIERRGLHRLEFERAPAAPEVLAEIERKAGLDDLRQELAAALSSLTPPVRDAIQLRVVDELDYPVVAERLEISEGTARVRVSRGLATLADLLDQTSPQLRTSTS